MQNYQDMTGKLFSFEDDIDVENLMQTNRNIPKTLTRAIKEKPSDNYVWYNGDWIHKQDKPTDYKELVSDSDVLAYNPAWITFLFKEGTIIHDEQNKFEIILEQINQNTYNGKELSKIITTLENFDEECPLPILVSVDGSIMLPVNDIYPTQEIAVNKFNAIISALFMGGIVINAVHLGDLEQGTLLEGGEYSFSYMSSSYNRFRNNWASPTELSALLIPSYINSTEIQNAYLAGQDVLNNISFSPIYLVQGYHSMQLWKTADALSNLWIVVEQLTNLIWDLKLEEKTKKILKRANIKLDNIELKHKIFHECSILEESQFQILNKNRKNRNDLLHEGKLPDHQLVEKLWIVLFELFEIASRKKLDKLFELTVDKQTKTVKRFSSNLYNEPINPKNTNFEEWIQTEKKL